MKDRRYQRRETVILTLSLIVALVLLVLVLTGVLPGL
jgi:predicted nucleic acid-binding Zn ribbon protein